MQAPLFYFNKESRSPKSDCLYFAKRPKFPLPYLGDRCGAPRGPNARTAATDRGSLAQGEEEEITCPNCSTPGRTLLDAYHTPALLFFNNSAPKSDDPKPEYAF